jgi:hypothetical protein
MSLRHIQSAQVSLPGKTHLTFPKDALHVYAFGLSC